MESNVKEFEAALNLEKEEHAPCRLALTADPDLSAEQAIDVRGRARRTTPWRARYGADTPPPAPLDSDPLIRTDFARRRGVATNLRPGHLPGPWNPKRNCTARTRCSWSSLTTGCTTGSPPPDLLECAAVSSDFPTGAALYCR